MKRIFHYIYIEVQQVGKFMRKEIKKREYALTTRNDYYCRLMRSKDRRFSIYRIYRLLTRNNCKYSGKCNEIRNCHIDDNAIRAKTFFSFSLTS